MSGIEPNKNSDRQIEAEKSSPTENTAPKPSLNRDTELYFPSCLYIRLMIEAKFVVINV